MACPLARTAIMAQTQVLPLIAIRTNDPSCGSTKEMAEYWFRKLSYPIVPMSGPLRPVRSLAEARKTLSERLPAHCEKSSHWERTSTLLLAAGATGSRHDIREFTDQFMRALDREGWLR